MYKLELTITHRIHLNHLIINQVVKASKEIQHLSTMKKQWILNNKVLVVEGERSLQVLTQIIINIKIIFLLKTRRHKIRKHPLFLEL